MSCLYSKYLCYRPLYQLDNTIDFTTYISRINHYFCGGDEISGLTQKNHQENFSGHSKEYGKNIGLKLIYCIYQTLVEPLVTYGSVIWWDKEIKWIKVVWLVCIITLGQSKGPMERLY